jgi:HEAT repeat protein/beta-lactamase regulating signal transducer with metallopeptidase domain
MFGFQLDFMSSASSGFLVKLLLDSVLKGAVLILFVGVCVYFWRKASASERSYLWLIALTGILLLPLLSLTVPSWRVAMLPDFSVSPEPGGENASAEQKTAEPSELSRPDYQTSSSLHLRIESRIDEKIIADEKSEEAQAREKRTARRPLKEGASVGVSQKSAGGEQEDRSPVAGNDESAQDSAAPQAPAMGTGQLLFLIWVTGSMLVLLWILLGKVIVLWIRHRAAPLVDEEWQDLLHELLEQSGINRTVGLAVSNFPSVAITSGLRKPMIILPAAAEDWDEERRRVVLLHELAHVRRWDSFSELLAQVISVFYWFNPLAWMAVRQYRRERERACDDAVLNSGTKPSSYAFHLMEVAKDMSTVHKPLWQAATISQGSSLKDRLLFILNPTIRRGAPDWFVTTLATLIFGALVLPLAAFSPWAQAPGPSVAQIQSVTIEDLDPLIADLSSDDPVVKARAAYKIESLGTKAAKAIPDLIGILGDEQQVDPVEIGYKSSGWGPNGHYWYTTPGREAAGALEEIGKQAVEPLLKALNDTDPTVRMRVVHILGELGDARAFGPILARLSDEDAGVRQAAAWAMGENHYREAIDPLRKSLSDESPGVREMAIWALMEMEDIGSTPAFAKALKEDENVEVRRNAAYALGESKQQDTVDALIAALKDPDSEVRETAVWALGELGNPKAVPALIEMLKDPEADIREKVLWALVEIGDKGAAEHIRPLIKDENADVRENAIWALSEFEDTASAPEFMAALDDENPDVREQAVWVLGEIKYVEAVPALIERLKDENADVREHAVIALMEIGDRRAVEALRALLRDKDVDVKKEVIWALSELGDTQSAAAISEALKDQSADVREAAAFALGELGNREAVPALMEAVSDSVADVREAAINALAELEDARAIEVFKSALNDADVDVRETAIHALSDLGADVPVDVFLEALSDDSPEIRTAAVHALSDLESPVAVPALIEALQDSVADVREGAAYALSDIRDSRAVDALIAALKDGSPDVREAAAHALGNIGDKRAAQPLQELLNDPVVEVRRAAAAALSEVM